MASLKSSRLWRCSFGLTKRLEFIRPFLAMASLKACQLWRCSFGLMKRLDSACVVASQPPPPVFRFPISRLIHDGALPPCRRCVVLGRVQRCPWPCATLSTAVINVVRGRGQRAEPVFATDFPLEAMERRGEEADNSVPSSSFGHLRASKGGGGVSICEILLIFAVRHFTQCIE